MSDLSYDIVTYCSQSYMQAFDRNIASWLKNTKAKNIYIYTDTNPAKFKNKNKRIIIKPMFKKCNDWIINVGKKTECILDYLVLTDSKNFAFIEMDCMIFEDFGEVFMSDMDISVTRMFSEESYTHATITCGVWFANINDNTKQFFNHWHIQSNKYKEAGIGVYAGLIAYDQLSFTDMIRPAFINKTMKVNPLNEKIYNCEHSKMDILIDIIIKKRPKIIHFKGGKFKNQEYVETILLAMRGKRIIKNEI